MSPNGELQKILEQAQDDFGKNEFDKAEEAFARVLSEEPSQREALLGRASSLREMGKHDAAHEVVSQGLVLHADDVDLLRERGLIFLAQQDYEKAIADFERVISINKDDLVARLMKTSALRFMAEAGDSNAREAALKLAEDMFADPSVATMFVNQLSTSGDHEGAEKLANRALELFPVNVKVLGESARALMAAGKFDQSEALVDKVLNIDAHDQLGLILKLTLLRRSHRELNPEELATCRRIAVEVVSFTKIPEVLIQCAWVFYGDNDYDKAYETFRKADTDDGIANASLVLQVQHRFREAEELIASGLERFPQSLRLLKQRADFYFDQANYDKAIENADKALSIDNTDVLIHLRKIASLRMQGRDRRNDKLAEAEKLADEAVEQFPESGDILLERGWVHFERNEFGKADTMFLKALGPDSSLLKEATFARSDALTRLNRGNEARTILEKLKESLPGNQEVCSTLGWFHLGRYDYFRAQREFETIPESVSDGSRDNGLGAVHFAQGNYDEAVRYFRKVVALNPDEPVFHNNLAWALVRLSGEAELDEAESECRRALELSPAASNSYGCLGIIAFKRGRLRDSEEYLRESTQLNEREGNYTDLGALYVQMGRYEEAEEQLGKALANNRNDPQALIELGNLHLLTDKVKQALVDLRQAIAIDAGNTEAHRALAIALMRSGDMGEAEKVLRTAIKRLDESKRWRLHLMLSQLLTKRGDDTDDKQFYEEALNEVNKSINLKPAAPEPYFQKGLIRYKLEDYYRAWKNFRDCLSRDKDHYEAERNARLVRSLIVKEKGIQLGSIIGAFLLVIVSVGQLVVLWVLHLQNENKVSEKMLIIMIPILLGLFVVAFLLPGLVRLKLPGLEAELSQPKQKESISSGPKGDLGSGTAPSISSGPK